MTAGSGIRAYVGAGSNIEPREHLSAAMAELARRFSGLRLSSVYRTAAVGFEGPDFLNLVASFETSLPVDRVIAQLDEIENAAGRRRSADRFSSRSLDLDLLMYGDVVDDTLKLPREDILEYAFVLAPMAEPAPDLVHPAEGATMRELWERFEGATQTISRLDGGLD